jgi:hypothetical protein
MSRRSLGILFLILSIASFIGAVPLLLSGVFKITQGFKPLATVHSPAEAVVQLEEADTYTLWHDFRTTGGSSTVSHPHALPGGFTMTLIRQSDGAVYPLDPARSHNTLSTPGRESIEVGTFAPSLPGTYTLKVETTGGEARAFSLTKGNFLHGMAQFGLRSVIACLLGFVGLVLLILGIVFILLKPTPQPDLHPPPLSS